MKLQPWMTKDEWIDFGMRAGYCGEPTCFNHDGVELSAEEELADEADLLDRCMFVIRIG